MEKEFRNTTYQQYNLLNIFARSNLDLTFLLVFDSFSNFASFVVIVDIRIYEKKYNESMLNTYTQQMANNI